MKYTPEMFRAIKGSKITNGLISGTGFLIGTDEENSTLNTHFEVITEECYGFAFLFGFCGLGHHYRLDIRPSSSVISLYQIRDGIPLYLHHVSVKLIPGMCIGVDIWYEFLRISLDKFQIISVLIDPVETSRIGITSLDANPYPFPTISKKESQGLPIQWLCLGDGFSNARWRNRSFVSWPEIVLGKRADFFNACVAAANSRRVSNLLQTLTKHVENCNILLATGSDDLIEGEPVEDFLERLHTIVSTLRMYNAKEIFIATLPPRRSAMNETAHWSNLVRLLCQDTHCQCLDFNLWLADHMDTMIYGEYPGYAAQRILAVNTARFMGLGKPDEIPLETLNDTRTKNKIILRAKRWLDQQAADFPGILT
jgi:hypothetical protein